MTLLTGSDLSVINSGPKRIIPATAILKFQNRPPKMSPKYNLCYSDDGLKLERLAITQWLIYPYHVTRVYLTSQSAPISTNQHNQEKIPWTFAHLVNVSAMFNNHKILLFWQKNKQTFYMFSLLDLPNLTCSVHLISMYYMYMHKGSQPPFELFTSLL